MNNEPAGGDPSEDYSAPIPKQNLPPSPSPLDAYNDVPIIGNDADYYYKSKNVTGLDKYNRENWSDFGERYKPRMQRYVEPGKLLSDYDQYRNKTTLYFSQFTKGLNKYGRLDESMLETAYGTQTVDSDQGGLAKAMRFAYSTPGVIFSYNREDGGILYDLREKHRAYYEDVEDGFTPARTNYDESTVTLAELAAQVKTLKRDLKRAGIL